MMTHLRLCLKITLTLTATALLFYGLLFFLTGCAVTPPADTHLPTVTQTQVQIHKSLLSLNILGIIGAAIGIGLGIYGLVSADSLEEKIGFVVGGVSTGLVFVTYAGLIVLPYAPWILLGTAVVAAGAGIYVAYRKYFAATTLSAAPFAPAANLPK